MNNHMAIFTICSLAKIILFALLYCGRSTCTAEEISHARFRRIVGGTQASPGQIPYQALVYSGGFFCGGVIISKEWILSAAHCYHGNDIKVAVGSMTNPPSNSNFLDATATVHKDYKKGVHGLNDLLLLKIKTLEISNNVNTVELPEKEDSFVGQSCRVSGFGRTNPVDSGSVSNRLLYTDTTILPEDQCRKKLEEIIPNYDNDKLICTGKSDVLQNACKGDSGGPLVCGTKLVGIVSCGIPWESGAPVAYARVSAYLNWIKQTQEGCSFEEKCDIQPGVKDSNSVASILVCKFFIFFIFMLTFVL